MDSAELEAALASFTRGLTLHPHWRRAYHYTEGVAFLVEHAGAHWLLDHIAAHQKRVRRDPMLRELQVWIIRKIARRTLRIACCRAPGDEAFHIDVTVFSGFPLDEVTLVLENETLMLPGERE
jgi:hypothetical protein